MPCREAVAVSDLEKLVPKALGTALCAKCGEAGPDKSLLAGRAKDRANTILTVKDKDQRQFAERRNCSAARDEELDRRDGKWSVVMYRT